MRKLPGGVPKAAIEAIFASRLNRPIRFHLFSCISNARGDVAESHLLSMLPDFFQREECLGVFLEPLVREGWITRNADGSCRAAGTSLRDYIEDDVTERGARVFYLRLMGATAAQVGEKMGMSTQECSRSFRRTLQSRPDRLRDDFYLPIFRRSRMSWETFHTSFPAESKLTYRYLTCITRGIAGRKWVNRLSL